MSSSSRGRFGSGGNCERVRDAPQQSIDGDGDAGHLPAGHGKLDCDRYLTLLCACGYKGPILLHGLSAVQVPGCAAFLREKLARVTAAPAAKAGRG